MGRKRSEDETWFRSPMVPAMIAGSNVDEDRGIMYNTCAAEECTAKGHNIDFDAKSLQMFADLSNSSSLGVPVDIGHDGMSDDSIGKRMGRAKGFSVVDKRILVNEIKFDRAALEDPKRQAHGLMMRAQDDPSSFGLSFVAKKKLEYRLDKDGTKLKGEDGKNLNPIIRPYKVISLDFVGRPAATDSLFSVKGLEGSNAMLSSGFTSMLDKLVESPDMVGRAMSFLSKYSSNRDNDDNDNGVEESKKPKEQQETIMSVTDEKGKFEAFMKIFGLKDKETSKVESDTSSSSSTDVDFMERAAISEVTRFVENKLSSKELTPGQLKTEGLLGMLSMQLCQAVGADKTKSDAELVRECPSMYALAESLDWDDAKILFRASNMFKVRDPFGISMNVLGNSPPFLAAQEGFSNFARIIGRVEGETTEIPSGGGKTVMSDKLSSGLDDGDRFFSTSNANVQAAITKINPEITDDASYLKYTYGVVN